MALPKLDPAWLVSHRETNYHTSHHTNPSRSPQPRPTARPVNVVRAATTYDTDDRGIVFLMMVPFFVIALSLGISQTVKPFITSLPAPGLSARAPVIIAPTPTVTVAKPTVPAPVIAPLDQAALAAQRLAAWTPPAVPWPRDMAPPRIDALPVPVSTAPLPRRYIPPVILAPPVMTLPDTPPLLQPPVIATPILPSAPQVCERVPPRALPAMGQPSVPPAAVGSAIAAAAFEQTKDFVVYSAKYSRLAYPMGDLSSLYGACSDVIIRAYRAIGLDLQELVQRARAVRSDANIDHRRTETLRKFFAQYGESLTPSEFPESYQPGDIVTYYRPFSRVSRAHIAIVSDVRAPTGRFMIVHNRGWGPQLEDALFVDRITGHYRFDGTRLPPAAPTTNATLAIATRTMATRTASPALPLLMHPHSSKPMPLSRAPIATPTAAMTDVAR
jgi:uncharacterized protein YijF (DUF1287 family)